MKPVRIIGDPLDWESANGERLTYDLFLPEMEPEPVLGEDDDGIQMCDDYWPRYYSSNSPFKRRSGYE